MDDVDYLVEDNARDDFFLSSEMDVTHGRTTFEDDPKLLEPHEGRFFLNSPFLLVVMLDVVLKARRQDQGDAMNQHPQERHLDREGRVSFVSPLSSYLMY